MTSPRPCLGHPTRTAAILALREEGLTTAEIAARIGDIAPKTVRDLERSAARASPIRQIGIPETILAALAPHARRRGLRVTQLARAIIETVVAEKLVDSVMDDGVET